ncbi:hypothetical protein VNI00_015880 [Paramarasmius palmivorus]|uniref:Uncharacterized protein n=1 Tax=Paramarasmius palmivorus TaxID=297713 RepID=A0AAW0BI37_9AGAR
MLTLRRYSRSIPALAQGQDHSQGSPKTGIEVESQEIVDARARVQLKWENRCKKIDNKLRQMNVGQQDNRILYNTLFDECMKPGHTHDTVCAHLDNRHRELEKLKSTLITYKIRVLDLLGRGDMVNRMEEYEARVNVACMGVAEMYCNALCSVDDFAAHCHSKRVSPRK